MSKKMVEVAYDRFDLSDLCGSMSEVVYKITQKIRDLEAIGFSNPQLVFVYDDYEGDYYDIVVERLENDVEVRLRLSKERQIIAEKKRRVKREELEQREQYEFLKRKFENG